jgi:hypothetical protein
MTRLFADPFLVTAFPLPSFFRRLPSPSIDPPSAVHQVSFHQVSFHQASLTKKHPPLRVWRGQGHVLVGSSENPECSLPPLRQVPYREMQPLKPQPLLRRCPDLVMRVPASIIDRAPRQTDEASRSQAGIPKSVYQVSEPSVGVTRLCRFASSRLWHSGAALRASSARSNVLGSIPGQEPSRSCPTIQAIFCVPELWKSHGTGPGTSLGTALVTKARGVPERSFCAVTTLSPAASNSVVTGAC